MNGKSRGSIVCSSIYQYSGRTLSLVAPSTLIFRSHVGTLCLCSHSLVPTCTMSDKSKLVKSDLVKSDGNPQDEISLSFPVLHFGDNDKITILCDGVVPVQGDVTMGQHDNTNQLHVLEKVAVGCTELLPKSNLAMIR